MWLKFFKKIFIYTGDTKQPMDNIFGDTRLIGEIIREGGGCGKIATPLPGGGQNRVLTEFLPVFYLPWFPKNIIKISLKRLDGLKSIN